MLDRRAFLSALAAVSIAPVMPKNPNPILILSDLAEVSGFEVDFGKEFADAVNFCDEKVMFANPGTVSFSGRFEVDAKLFPGLPFEPPFSKGSQIEIDGKRFILAEDGKIEDDPSKPFSVSLSLLYPETDA